MDKSRLELKLGIFVFIALAILAVFIFKIGNLKNYGTGYEMRFIFLNVSGVKTGSPVRFSGVDVGEVSRVNILKEEQSKNTLIEVVAWVNRAVSIPSNSKAYINTLGLLGEKYIEVIPPVKYASFIKPGDVLYGIDPTLTQEWIDEAQKAVKDLREIIENIKAGQGTIGKLLYEDKLYNELEALVTEIRQAKHGTIGKLLYEDTLHQELEALISDIRRNPWKLFWKTREKKANK